jgi:hypothetical protein
MLCLHFRQWCVTVRKTEWQALNEDEMRRVVDEVIEGHICYKKALFSASEEEEIVAHLKVVEEDSLD